MIKYFYCFRHGKTDYNAKGLLQGSEIDAPLNEEGRQQALDIPHIDLDIIYCSPLKRAVETASIYSRNKIPVIVKENLTEISFNKWSGKSWKYLKENDLNNYKRFLHFDSSDLNLRPGNGESAQEVFKRIYKTLKEIVDNSKDTNIGIFSHGGVWHYFANIIVKPTEPFLVLKNSEYFKFSYDTETEEFKLENR